MTSTTTLSQGGTRPCPVCGGRAGGKAFPFATRFNNIEFSYLRCTACRAVFVDPAPDSATLAKMYSRENYHVRHYDDVPKAAYHESAKLLRRFAPQGARVLDYGCGFGAFLSAARETGFDAFGVEFDAAAAKSASENSGCTVIPVSEFDPVKYAGTFDVVHLGDVIEHLAEPIDLVRTLVKCLKPAGILFTEGPLENNPSPVYWSAKTFGALARSIGRKPIPTNAPTHLMRVSAAQQRLFFSHVAQSLREEHWEVSETGWPYINGKGLKKQIGRAAKAVGGKTLMGVPFGNRFRAMHRLAA
jgi:2-polyprenyl-3-methyl-5-hydroxy-6-metoxy-1,4-benzoquinol methylase